VFYFALPGGLEAKQRAPAEWVVEFPSKSAEYTRAAKNDATKYRPECSLPVLSVLPEEIHVMTYQRLDQMEMIDT
jgi:hypothetical protein